MEFPMKSKLAFVPLFSPARRNRPRVRAVLVCLLTLSATAHALEEDGLTQTMPVQDLQIQEVSEQDAKQRPLRSLFISSHDSGAEHTEPAEPIERRRLNAEERSALRRDLRDAMRGAYPDHTSTRDKQR